MEDHLAHEHQKGNVDPNQTAKIERSILEYKKIV